MPIVRRALTVVAVTAAGTVAFAVPAWAHTPHFVAGCDEVTIQLSRFSGAGDNTVHVLRDGQELAEGSPVTFGRETTIHVPESWDADSVTYRVQWSEGELADDFTIGEKRLTYFEDTLTKPADCEEVPPTTETPTTTGSPESPEAPEAPSTSTAPVVAPATTAPAPAPSPTAQASKLANTGAGNTVPLAVAGSVLVAGGAGLMAFTRRRRRTTRATG